MLRLHVRRVLRRLTAFATVVAALSSPAQIPAAEATTSRALLVTVDDLPIAGGSLHGDPAERRRITNGLLAALQRHKVPAVGLVIWGSVTGPQDEELLGDWLRAGHELGNHSLSHLSYTQADPNIYIDDVESARVKLAAFLVARGHRPPRFFRFPFLREGETLDKLRLMRDYLRSSGQRNLPVTIDDQDWSFEKPWVEARRRGDRAEQERVKQDYLSALRLMVRHHESTGDDLFGRSTPQILLLHANEIGSAAWDDLFTWLEMTGHRFAPADEVLADPAFGAAHDYVGPYGPGLWDRLLDQRRARLAADQVAALLQAQAASWNAGDLESFCSVYADDALFVSPSGVTRGRQAVLDRYRARYPTREAMGTLSLEIIETRPASGTEVSLLGDAVPGRVQGVSVAAKWTLTHADKSAATGHTLLVLRRRAEGWEIVQDASM